MLVMSVSARHVRESSHFAGIFGGQLTRRLNMFVTIRRVTRTDVTRREPIRIPRGVLVAPCDLPLLSASHLTSLLTDLVPDEARVAEVEGRTQASLAVWPAAWARRLQREVDGGARAFRHALTVGEWTTAELPRDALADADTREELDRLLDSQDGPADRA
mgnify:CR=1 FL=1